MNAQADLIEQTFNHYQESLQQLGSLAAKATRDARSTMNETEAAGERVARQLQSGTKEMGWGNRPKENPMRNGGEERREPVKRGAY